MLMALPKLVRKGRSQTNKISSQITAKTITKSGSPFELSLTTYRAGIWGQTLDVFKGLL
jgi:hypothetical protein